MKKQTILLPLLICACMAPLIQAERREGFVGTFEFPRTLDEPYTILTVPEGKEFVLRVYQTEDRGIAFYIDNELWFMPKSFLTYGTAYRPQVELPDKCVVIHENSTLGVKSTVDYSGMANISLVGYFYVPPEPVPPCLGDLNGDGWLSPDDVRLLLAIIVPHAQNNYWVECPRP